MITMNARFRFYAVAMISLLAAGQALADESRDFSGLSADSSALQGRQQELLSQQNEYLKGRRKLRSQSDEDMARLINEICGTDIKRSENYGLDIAMRMADDVRARISDIYEPLKAEKDKIDKEIDDQKKDLEEIQSKYAYLANSSEYGDKAKPILEEIKREIEETKTVKDSVMRDFNSLTNVSDGIMKGANNPQVRAAMDYGKDRHEKMQGDLGCDDKEVAASGGFADCVKFTESDGCVVIEIKPDTYSESKAIKQAEGYIPGLKSKYKDNDNAKKYCKQDSDGNWIFKAAWKTYPACKPGSL
jgi:archaellum component FlaC